jgi:nucleoside-diphosphate-sugar epimerase
MNDLNRRILITGSTGCIGTHAVDFLLAEEAGQVFGFNRSIPENINDKKGYHFISGDLSNSGSLKK